MPMQLIYLLARCIRYSSPDVSSEKLLSQYYSQIIPDLCSHRSLFSIFHDILGDRQQAVYTIYSCNGGRKMLFVMPIYTTVFAST